MKNKNKPRKAQKPNPQLQIQLQALALTEIINHEGKEEFLFAMENVFEYALFHTPAEMFNQNMQHHLYIFNSVLQELRRS
jgi:hypothetical protein